MHVIVTLTGKTYARHFEDFSECLGDVTNFLEGGNPVCICDSLEDLQKFVGVDVDEIEVVELE